MDTTFRRNTLILVVSLTVILILYVAMFWLPHRRRTAELLSAIQAKREAIEAYRQQGSQIPKLNGELALLETYNAQVVARIPPALNVKEFLATVHSVSQKQGVTVSNVTPHFVTELLGIQQQPISLTLVGSFHSIVQLMYELETMNRMIELADLDMRSSAQASAGDGALEVKLTVRLFARPPKSAPPAQNDG